MKIKITNREKIMLIILAVFIVLGLYYNFIYFRQINKIKDLNVEKQGYKTKIDELQKDKVLNVKIKKDIKICNAKIYEAVKEFFPSIIEEKIIVILDDMINKNNIQCDSVSITGASDEKVVEKKSNDKKKENALDAMVNQYKNIDGVLDNSAKKENNKENNKDNKNEANQEAKKISIAIAFKGTHDDVMKFIDEIKGFYKRIIIKNLNITAEGDNLTGNMVLDFYAVPKFEEEDIDYNKWQFDGEYGKTNMFKDNSSGKITLNTKSNNEEKKELENNFYISVKPLSSDLPTFMMGKAKDSQKSTYVYADSNGVENGEIYFIQKNDKYYYKYKISGEAYPKNFVEEEFKPYGSSINLKIYSTPRNSVSDMSGANIKIYNKTNLKANVSISQDDKERPRINILKQGGSIEVNRN